MRKRSLDSASIDNNVSASFLDSRSSGGTLAAIPHRSSYSSNSSHNIGSHDDALRRMLKLVNSFFSRSDCIPFREPVDWRALELWDYPKIIKKVSIILEKKRNETQSFNKAFLCTDNKLRSLP